MKGETVFYESDIVGETMSENNFTNLNCESCGADIVIPKGESSVKCGFCGTLNKLSAENQKPSNKQRTLMINAVDSENWEDVGKYATSLLEEDPSDYEAWFYKGASAGWTSRHIDDPSKEILNTFRNAFANSSDESLDDAMDMLGSKGVDLLMALARGSRGFAQDHGYFNTGDMFSSGWQADTMNGHVNKIFGFINVAHLLTEINRNDRVNSLNPALDAAFIKLYAFLYTSVSFEGAITAKNPFNLTATTWSFVYDPNSEFGLKWVPRVEEILEAHKNKAYSEESLERYGLSDSDFQDPRAGDAQEAAASGGCFVATAVYGNEGHFNLIILRSFRDNFLRQYSMGRAFIAFYYEHGPKLANKVKESIILKAIFTPLVGAGVFIVRLFKLG